MNKFPYKPNEDTGVWSVFAATNSSNLIKLLKSLCRKVAKHKGYLHRKYHTCYIMSNSISMEEVLFEYDILESNEKEIAIEGYLYLR